jgi:hypothetical protein
MPNHAPLPKLAIPDKKSNLTAVDDTTQLSKWEGDAPDEFAAQIRPVSPNRYKKKVTAEASTKRNEHVDLVVAKEVESKAVSEEEGYWATQGAMIPKNNDESETVDKDIPLMEEQSPTVEEQSPTVEDDDPTVGDDDPTVGDDEISPSFSNFGAEVADNGGRTAMDELGANFGNDSDSGSEYNAFNLKNDIGIDSMYTNKSIESGFANHSLSDDTSDVANDLVESTTESNTESSQSREPDTHQGCQECVSLRERIAELEAQNAALTKKAISSVDAGMNTETPPEQDWQPSYSSVDAGINTETPPEQDWQPSYLRERDIEWQVSTSSLLPLAASIPMQTTTAQSIQACLDTVKKLYLVLTGLEGIALQLGQELSPSYVCRSIPLKLKEKAYMFKDLIKAATLYISTPFWFAINLVLFVNMHQEKETWMQANSLTRKHLLKHANGESSLFWELFFTIGSLVVLH